MEELLGWLFEGETRLVIFALIAAMLLVKWLVESARGIAIALRETRRK
jgi:hypothetical protein